MVDQGWQTGTCLYQETRTSKFKKSSRGNLPQVSSWKGGLGQSCCLWRLFSVCPEWLDTMGVVKGYQEGFYKFCIFHNRHLGIGKRLCQLSCIVMELPGTTREAFETFSQDFLSYCAANHESPYHKKLSASLFGVEQSFQDCPEGGWSKGDFTRLQLQWFGDFFVPGRWLGTPKSHYTCSALLVNHHKSRLYFVLPLKEIIIINFERRLCFYIPRLKLPLPSTSAWVVCTMKALVSPLKRPHTRQQEVFAFWRCANPLLWNVFI